MRKYAVLKEPKDKVVKIMLYEVTDGVYLFEYDTVADYLCCSDLFFSTIEEALTYCDETYSIKDSDWIMINDPFEYCQNDLISPVRIKGRDIGKPVWGEYEILSNGKWVEHQLK